MARHDKKDDQEEGIKVIARNKRAFHQYNVFDRLECGIALTGTEVKSLREGSASLEDAYAKIDRGEVWLLGSDIPEYAMGNRMNHKPKRPRKLLLHRREIGCRCGCIFAAAEPRSSWPSLAANSCTTSAKPSRRPTPSATSAAPSPTGGEVNRGVRSQDLARSASKGGPC